MARRAEEIERNRGRFRKNLVGGTEISNLANVIVGVANQFTVYKKRADQAMLPLRLANAVVLQLLTDRDRVAELTVMPAVLSTTIDRDALSLHGATTLVWVGSVGPRPRASGYIEEANDLLSATRAGLTAAGAVPPVPSTPVARGDPQQRSRGRSRLYLCCCCDHGALKKLDKASYLALY